MNAVVFAFLHHLAVLLLFACLFYQHLALKPELSLHAARQLARIDLVFGLSAAAVLLAGVLRVLWFEKSTQYYLLNWAFYLKISLFIAVALLSIYPTVVMLGWRKSLREGEAPVIEAGQMRRLLMVIRAELLLVTLMIPPAVLMAKGYGYYRG